MKQKISVFMLAFLFLFLVQIPAQATLVKSVNIKTLTRLAKFIVKAEVIRKDTMIDVHESGKLVTFYTLKVKSDSDWIKGEPLSDDGVFVIKQLANGIFEVDGVAINQSIYFPVYEVGQTYLFFLPEAHGRTGLLAPIALFQGVFHVTKDVRGNEILPQLKSRMRLLRQGVTQSNKNKFLNMQLNNAQQNDTYESFKSLIKAAMDS